MVHLPKNTLLLHFFLNQDLFLPMSKYYLHLGSNSGDRLLMLSSAILAIESKIGKVVDKSSIYETEPWGLKEQEHFLNQALIVDANLSLEEVFGVTKDIEKELGCNKLVQWGPRTIDIDILYADHLVLDTPTLKIPHPQLYHRNFVLIPLMEIAGDFVDPLKNMSIEEIYDECEDEREVLILD
jgi:2-amino-4-hydroxy-6-hydroxymethyldihydropteridine diphosphokinase